MQDEGLSAGAVSRRLGIAVTTLRTWHQRYGLGPTGHRQGSHRRYHESDLARLETMRTLTSQGVPAAEAARIASAGRPDGDAAPARHGGGNTFTVGSAGPAAQGLARAAMRLDVITLRDTVQRAVDEHGVAAAWTGLLVPVLVGIGRRHAATRRLVEVEHLLSRCISEVLGAVRRPVAAVPNRILLACADEEQHSLPLEALAAALAERDVACRMLGARVPPAALHDAVRRTGPALVVLWSQMTDTADPGQLTALAGLPRRPVFIAAGGPGWAHPLPDGVLTPTTLPEALDLALGLP